MAVSYEGVIWCPVSLFLHITKRQIAYLPHNEV